MDLGEHIVLDGFVENEPGELVVAKKMIGNFVKKFSERHDFQRLVLTHKGVHNSKHEIHGKLTWAGKEVFAEVTDNNVFFTLDACLKKLETQVEHKH